MNHPLFAVTREDYRAELALIRQYKAQNILLICSGGCTPFCLQATVPELQITAFDINPKQLEHAKRKQLLIAEGNHSALEKINHYGEFESLFRVLRQAFLEFITSEEEIDQYFSGRLAANEQQELVLGWQNNKYYAAPFHIALNDPFLHIMFTEKATQHAGPQSYPAYFQRKITAGLLRDDGPSNPFLQHIFLDRYLPKDAPPYFKTQRFLPINFVLGSLPDLENLQDYQVVSLSNVFDWSDASLIEAWAQQLRQLPQGAVVLIRQLNNHRNWFSSFQADFTEDMAFDHYWQKHERSLFYDHFRVFVRT